MGNKNTIHFSSLDQIKEQLGEDAYKQAKAQLETQKSTKAPKGVEGGVGGGGVLHRATICNGKLEYHPVSESERADEVEEADSANCILGPCTLWVQVECYRERDVDDFSAKWALDALVTAGVLKGDSLKTIIRVVKEAKIVSRDKPERTTIKLFRRRT